MGNNIKNISFLLISLFILVSCTDNNSTSHDSDDIIDTSLASGKDTNSNQYSDSNSDGYYDSNSEPGDTVSKIDTDSTVFKDSEELPVTCNENIMPDEEYAEYYSFCINNDEPICMTDINSLVSRQENLSIQCTPGSSGIIKCDQQTQTHCMIDPASNVSKSLLCTLTTLGCITKIYNGVWLK